MLLLCKSVCTCGLAGVGWRQVLATEEVLLCDGVAHRHVTGQGAVNLSEICAT